MVKGQGAWSKKASKANLHMYFKVDTIFQNKLLTTWHPQSQNPYVSSLKIRILKKDQYSMYLYVLCLIAEKGFWIFLLMFMQLHNLSSR